MAATNKEVWQLGTIVESADIATDIRRIVFEVSQPKAAEPGSHIDVRVCIADQTDRRSYSIVESGADGKHLAISVLRAPMSRGGSVFMHGLREGDTLEITQPLQNFPLRIGAARYMLLAGGIGITAIASMARVLRRLNADYRFVYVGRARPAMAYLPDLQALHGDNLEVHIDDEETPLHVDKLLREADRNTELYVCGPIRLMDAVRRAWYEQSLVQSNLRYETFGNSGWSDPNEFVVRIPRLEVVTRVGANQTMLEALEDVGVDMMFDCRKGECGLCEVKILQLQGAVDHRDVFYSERQQRASRKMCCCVSRVTHSAATDPARTTPESDLPVVTIDVS